MNWESCASRATQRRARREVSGCATLGDVQLIGLLLSLGWSAGPPSDAKGTVRARFCRLLDGGPVPPEVTLPTLWGPGELVARCHPRGDSFHVATLFRTRGLVPRCPRCRLPMGTRGLASRCHVATGHHAHARGTRPTLPRCRSIFFGPPEKTGTEIPEWRIREPQFRCCDSCAYAHICQAATKRASVPFGDRFSEGSPNGTHSGDIADSDTMPQYVRTCRDILPKCSVAVG